MSVEPVVFKELRLANSLSVFRLDHRIDHFADVVEAGDLRIQAHYLSNSP